MQAQGYPVSIAGVAQFYHDFLDVLVVDLQDSAQADEIQKSGTRVHCTKTVMRAPENRIALAQEVLGLALRPPATQAAVEHA
jgi:LPPG:FO 2-phospho-L-lactate transferase